MYFELCRNECVKTKTKGQTSFNLKGNKNHDSMFNVRFRYKVLLFYFRVHVVCTTAVQGQNKGGHEFYLN